MKLNERNKYHACLNDLPANGRRSLFYPIIEQDNYLFAMVKLASVYCNETMEGAQHGE